ncbi:hypothetical protein BH23PLA1_BH23PLA1_01540 [soil metagenome]
MILQRIAAILQQCDGDSPWLPPTHLFNENWLLRLVLDWFARHEAEAHPLAPLRGATWFSEAWLPSAFLPRFKKDRLAESWTHADGAIGHFITGNRGWADLVLLPEARQLVVLEGKMFSRLSSGVKNAPWYDQAARTVACLAEILQRAGRHPMELEALAFHVVAPRRRIEEGVFLDETAPGSILRRVRRRVEDYAGSRDDWFRDWFVPTMRRIEISALSWEDMIETVALLDPEAGQELDSYYGKCLHYNRPQSATVRHELGPGPPPVEAPVPSRARGRRSGPLIPDSRNQGEI